MQKSNDWTALQTLKNITVETPITTTGDVTSGSAVITNIPSTAGLSASVFVVSVMHSFNTRVLFRVDSSTQVTVDMPCYRYAGGHRTSVLP